jgi:hypothetical protein
MLLQKNLVIGKFSKVSSVKSIFDRTIVLCFSQAQIETSNTINYFWSP